MHQDLLDSEELAIMQAVKDTTAKVTELLDAWTVNFLLFIFSCEFLNFKKI